MAYRPIISSSSVAVLDPQGSNFRLFHRLSLLFSEKLEPILSTAVWLGNCFFSIAQGVSTYSDEQLVEDFKKGDRRAFDTLVVRYQDRAFRFCLRYLGNRERAEEAAQDAFVRVYKNLHRFRGDSSFSTWFYRVVGNHCKNMLQASGRRAHDKHDSLDADRQEGGAEPVADPGMGPEGALGVKRRQMVVAKALSELEDEERKLLILREIEGQSYDEIAEVLAIPLGTVKSRIYRARQALKVKVHALQRRGGPL